MMTADEWNEWYKPGHPVILTDDEGKEHQTRTRSVAWSLGCGHHVVKVEGWTGGYSLNRIRAMEAHSCPATGEDGHE